MKGMKIGINCVFIVIN